MARLRNRVDVADRLAELHAQVHPSPPVSAALVAAKSPGNARRNDEPRPLPPKSPCQSRPVRRLDRATGAGTPSAIVVDERGRESTGLEPAAPTS